MATCPGCGSYVDDDELECSECGVTLHVERLKPPRLRRRKILTNLICLAIGLALLVLLVGDGTIDNEKVRMTVVSVAVNDEASDGTTMVTLHVYIENHRDNPRGGAVVPKIDEFELTTDKGAIYPCSPSPQNRVPRSIFQGEDGYVTLCFSIPSGEKPSLLRFQWGAAFSSTATCPSS
jgi:predicted nucleic acid-binding Zn ribbon protein